MPRGRARLPVASKRQTLTTDSTAVCQAITDVDTALVQSLVNTSIPVALAIVTNLPLDDQPRLPVQDRLVVFQTTLSAALPTQSPDLLQVLAAIVDFAFNLGVEPLRTSTLWRRVNQRDWIAASRELR